MNSSTNLESVESRIAPAHHISSIQVLFRNHEHLGEFLFHHRERRLRERPAELLKEARRFSRVERILVRTALDFLPSGSGNARILDILEQLENEDVLALIRAILRLREMDLYVTLWEEPCCD